MPAPGDPGGPRAAAPTLAATARLTAVALWVLVVPGAVERLGWVPDDEAARLPIVAAALAVEAFARRAAGGGASRTTWWLAGLALVVALLGASAMPRHGASATPETLALLLPLAIFAGARRFATEGARRRGAVAAAVAAGVTAVWVLADRLAGRPPVGPLGRTGVSGPTLTTLCALGVGVGVALPRRAGARYAVLGVGALCALAVAAGGSTTGVVACVAAACTGALVATAHPRRVLVAGAVVVAGGVAALAFVLASSPSALPTVRVRLGLARSAGALVAERPLAGHGLGGFAREALRVRDLEEARISAGGRPLAAHDDVLEATVAGGVGAGLALAGLLVGAGVLAVRRARRAPAGERATRGALAAAIVAVAVASVAENPLRSTPTILLFGLAVGAATADPAARAGSRLRAGAGLLLLAAAGAHVRAIAVADDAVALDGGTFLATEGLRVRGYEVAAREARAGRFAVARARYATLLDWDPGATEARLDVAETYRLEGRRDDAESVLLAAARVDPTRFDVPHRLGHLRLGPEAPPSERAKPRDAVAILKAYNAAAALAPGRFETQVAYARVHRRHGDLAAADHALEAAANAAAARGQGAPAELLLETFRLAEAVGAPLADRTKALAVALVAGPGAAGEVRAEAEAALDAAEARERAAAPGATAGVVAADRDAAAVRLAGLLRAGLASRDALVGAARRSHAEGAHGRAVAFYRALLADPFALDDTALVLEARAAAAPADPERATAWAARARTLLGFEALARDELADAARQFEAALGRDAHDALALFGRARVLARQGHPDEARRELDRAAALDPSARDAALRVPELAPLLR